MRSGLSFPTTLPVESPFDWMKKPKCPECGAEMKEGEIHPKKVVNGYVYTWWCSNPECMEEHARRFRPGGFGNGNGDSPEKELRKYGIEPAFAGATLKTFLENPAVVKAAREYAEKPEGNLLISGATGRGKTHLAMGIIREMLEKGKRNIFFRYIPELLAELKNTYEEGRETYITERDVYERYCGYDFLVLDDLGTEKSTDWAVQAMETIVDKRMRNLLPTAVTTNLTPVEIDEQIDPRLASRIASGKIWTLNGPDWRTKR